VLKKALDKELFAECYIFDTRQRSTLPSVKKKHSAKKLFAEYFLLPMVFCVALDKLKSLFAECPKKTLGKVFGTRQRAKFQ
jgi:type VI protein secretion system component VasA